MAYTTFAIGFVARPVGGLIFGHFGDRIGRKSMLVLTLMIMGVATVLIGLLPTYQQIGVAAPILLLVLRVLQGIGLGGEWGGAVSMTYEYATEDKRGLYASFPQIGLSIGLCLSAGVVALASSLPEDQFLAWGWRVGFLISIVLVIVGLYIRLRIMETPEFTRLKAQRQEVRIPFMTMLREYPRNILLGMGARYIDGVFFNVFAVFSIAYLVNTVHINRTTALWAVFASALVMIAFIPLFGRLSDKWGRGKTYAIGSILLAISAFPAFWLMSGGNIVAIFIAHGDPVWDPLCDVLRARSRAVLRSLRCPRALYRHLVRLSVLRNLRVGHYPDHRHLSDRRQRRSALVSLRLRSVRRVGERRIGGRDQRHGIASIEPAGRHQAGGHRLGRSLPFGGGGFLRRLRLVPQRIHLGQASRPWASCRARPARVRSRQSGARI